MNTRQLHLGDARLAQSVVSQFHERSVSTSYIEKFLANPFNYLLVAEADEQVIGFLSAHALDSIERESAAMFIYEIEVEETHQRQGAGRALINHARTLANEAGMFEMFVLTHTVKHRNSPPNHQIKLSFSIVEICYFLIPVSFFSIKALPYAIFYLCFCVSLSSQKGMNVSNVIFVKMARRHISET